MQVIKTLIVAAAIAGVAAQEATTSTPIKSQTDQNVKASELKDGQEMLPVTTNAQSQTCSSMPFVEVDSLMYPHDHSVASLQGHFKDPLDIFYPNVKWAPVHHSLWSFDDKVKDATNPLGFRQAAFKDNTPLCLHMSSATAHHKLELMIDFMHGSKICVEDIRTAHMNPNVELIRSCDDKGKINRCFSALDGKYARDQEHMMATNPMDTNFAEQPADFAVAIGCFGGGCRDDASTSRLYYRVRQSVKAWTDNQGGAGEGLDYWCMSMAALNPNYGIFRAPGHVFQASEINKVPQMYPSDMWATVTLTRDNDDAYNDEYDYNEKQAVKSPASAVTAGIATAALAVLSLMF